MKSYKVVLFILFLSFRSYMSIKVIRTPANVDKTFDGIVRILNVSVSEENTLFFKVKTYQFYQFFDSKKGIIWEPWQTVISMTGLKLITVPAVPCPEFHEICTNQWMANIGDQWEHGKTFMGLYGDKYFPSWKPGVWNSIFITFSQRTNQLKLFVNGNLLRSIDTVLDLGGRVDISLMNDHQDPSWPLSGAVTNFNVWDRILTEQEMKEVSKCESILRGNLVNWDTTNLVISGFDQAELEEENICDEYSSPSFSMFFHSLSSDEIVQFCSNIGAEIAVAIDEKILNDMSSVASTPITSFYFFTGYHTNSEGQWVDALNNDPLSWNLLDGATLYNDKPGKRCLWHHKDNGTLDGACTDILPICKMPSNFKEFYLRGACKGLKVDVYFIMENPFFFRGYIFSNIMYSQEKSRWEVFSTITEETIAYTNGTLLPPIGVRKWHFIADKCTDSGQSDLRTLHLHLDVEMPGHFCCEDGTCLGSDLVCDGSPDCRGEEDEADCRQVLVPDYYDRTRAPARISLVDDKRVVHPSYVKVNITILDVLEVNEVESHFEIFYDLHFQWFDPSLIFPYLKFGEEINEITNISQIWYPDISFYHVIREEVIKEKIFVHRNTSASATLSGDFDSLKVSELYAGSEHILELSLTVRHKMVCSFDNIQEFPFKEENCFINFFLQGKENKLITFEPYFIENLGPEMVNQYLVKGWSIEPSSRVGSNDRTMKMTLVLSRKFSNIFLVTYLPTILMNIINQATNYLVNEGKYELIIQVNITCMMVLASVYLSVSSSLPGTPDIKPVEVWLLFNLAYPFMVIISNIMLQGLEKKLYGISIHTSDRRNPSGRFFGNGNEDKSAKKYFIDRKFCIIQMVAHVLNPVVYIFFVISYFTIYYQ